MQALKYDPQDEQVFSITLSVFEAQSLELLINYYLKSQRQSPARKEAILAILQRIYNLRDEG